MHTNIADMGHCKVQVNAGISRFVIIRLPYLAVMDLQCSIIYRNSAELFFKALSQF